jgi:hypothetical protein
MTGSNSFWFANPSSGFYNSVATQSLRFENGDSAYLNETAGTPTDSQKWTSSLWVKRGSLGSEMGLVSSSATAEYIRFESDDTLRYRLYQSGAQRISMITSAVFRDITAWYHIVCAVDLSNTTDNDKVIIYVNGTRQALGTNTTTTTDTYDSVMLTSGNDIWIGRNSSSYFDGYMAEINFIDGLQLAPTSFGETKEGAWIPKDTSGLTFGDNGFRLQFKQTGTGTASTSTIGADTANSNHFTSNNLVATDSNIPDSPENNFATLNPLRTNRLTETYSEGNLRYASSQTSTNPATTSTIAVSSGKWYWEVFIKAQGNTANSVGIIDVEYGMENDSSAGYTSSSGVYSYQGAGTERSANGSPSYGDSWTDDDLIGVALDMDNGNVYFYKNGTIQNSGTALQGSLDTTGSGTYSAYSLVYSNGDQIYNFGQDGSFNAEKTAQGNTDGNGVGNFFYSVPSGYLALCTSNLPEPTISPNADTQSNDHFDGLLYTGNSQSAQDIGGLGFQPDFVWIKGRSYADHHALFDSTRGVGKYIISSSTNAEGDYANTLDEFRSDGFGVGADSTALVNYQTNTYVAWNWKANGGTTTTNDASSTGVGSIDSVYQANTTAGFSIVTFTTDGVSSGTVAHGLGVQPKLLLGKTRNHAVAWAVQSTLLATNQALILNTTSAAYNPGYNHWNDTHPTSSVFSVGGYMADHSDLTNPSTKIVYCFAEVAGFSKIGLYTGCGNANGTYVHTGFKPAWIMIKRTDTTGSWYIYDYKRLLRNPLGSVNQPLLADTTGAEGGADASWYIDGLSNGFKLKNASNFDNASSGTYLYMAFAEMPFKYSNAR